MQDQLRETNRDIVKAIMEAMLLCCGEVGYRRTTVEQVYERCGLRRSEFFRHFSGKGACFLAAYEWQMAGLAEQATKLFGDDDDLEPRLHRALLGLATFATRHESMARAVIIEVHAAGRAAAQQRQSFLKEIAVLLDETCRVGGSGAAPPLAGEFFVGAIDRAAATALSERQPAELESTFTELVLLIIRAYEPV